MIEQHKLRILSTVFSAFLPLSCLTASFSQSVGTQGTELESINQGLESVAQKTLPCVIQISGLTLVAEDETDKNGENDLADTGGALGSGIIVSPDGLIITNAHVVSGLHRIRVSLRSSEGNIEKQAKLIGVDRDDDLAVIKVAEHGLPYMDISHIAAPEQGEIAVAFGSPFGLQHTMTMGIVSDVGKQTDIDDPRIWIQTDAAVNPGNSGGPLVDIHGDLLGVNTMTYSSQSGGGNLGVALAIPASTVVQVYHQLVENGKVIRPSLGLRVTPLTPSIASALSLKPTTGMLIEGVDVNSPADKSGIVAGDVLVSLNGNPVKTFLRYIETLNALHPGTRTSLQFWHGGNVHSVELTPEVDEGNPLPLAMQVRVSHNLIRRLEILAVPLTSSEQVFVGPTLRDRGVIVAARSSTLRINLNTLQERDVIYQVNGKDVDTLQSLQNVLDAIPHGAPLVLQIERNHRLMYVPLEGAR
jgi:serine protease Do